MKQLKPSWRERVDTLQGGADDLFVWCLDMPLHVSSTTHVRVALTNNVEPVTAGGIKFYPWGMQMGVIEEDSEGNLPSLAITLANQGRMLMPYFELADPATGPMNRDVVIYLLPTGDPTIDTQFTFQWRLAGVTADRESLTLTLEPPNFWQRDVPQDRYHPGQCQWQYGVPPCPYVLGPTAAFPDCPRTLEACIERGLDHAARNLPVLMPERFGGFLGVPRS